MMYQFTCRVCWVDPRVYSFASSATSKEGQIRHTTRADDTKVEDAVEELQHHISKNNYRPEEQDEHH